MFLRDSDSTLATDNLCTGSVILKERLALRKGKFNLKHSVFMYQ